ncbi:MAG TPA: hypothetical protein VKY92_07930 [Verrucomicrobiae bacterium]|nr:hypothetical protein [Verrucomicrobiae bacterium]
MSASDLCFRDISPLPKPHAKLRLARRLLLTAATLATILAGFYTEENWRGQRAWIHCRRDLERQGAVFDWSTRVPPPVPDEQNFFGVPQMAKWFVGRKKNDLSEGLDDPRTHAVSMSGTNAIQTAAQAREYLAWSDQFVPEFDQIREALSRPSARINCDYGQPLTVQAPNFYTIRNFAQALSQRAHCFLLLSEPEKAVEELTLLHEFCRVLDCPPCGKPITLVGAMIHVAVTGLYADTVAEGLRSHAWREPQLKALQRQLSEIHLEFAMAETLVDEPMFTLRTLQTSSRAELVKLAPNLPRASRWLLYYAPRGWLDQYMVFHARLNQEFRNGFDSSAPSVSPAKTDQAGGILSAAVKNFSLYRTIGSWAIPNWVKALQRYAANQTLANEGAVACALEQYRLAQGGYPRSLEMLVPRFIDKIPRDVIGGQPLRYEWITGDEFRLYSLGWNGRDDGGNAGTNLVDGDWVWGESSQAITR